MDGRALRRTRYDLDEGEVKQFFEFERVLVDGVFFMAEQLYGVTMRERDDIPVYHEDVRVFEMFDACGDTVGLFYADYYARSSKRGGAWMSSFVDQSTLRGEKPVVINVMNIKKPSAGPTLLSFDEVTTMFHEFGHGVHGMFSAVRYPMLSGTAVPRDYVEFPSQFHEDFAFDPAVLARCAKHHATGAPMPRSNSRNQARPHLRPGLRFSGVHRGGVARSGVALTARRRRGRRRRSLRAAGAARRRRRRPLGPAALQEHLLRARLAGRLRRRLLRLLVERGARG